MLLFFRCAFIEKNFIISRIISFFMEIKYFHVTDRTMTFILLWIMVIRTVIHMYVELYFCSNKTFSIRHSITPV